MAQSPPVVSPIRPQKAPSWRSSHSADSSRRCSLLLSGKPRDWPCFSQVIWSPSLYNDRLETWLTVDFVAMAAEDSKSMIVNFAERAHNHNWELDPVTR